MSPGRRRVVEGGGDGVPQRLAAQGTVQRQSARQLAIGPFIILVVGQPGIAVRQAPAEHRLHRRIVQRDIDEGPADTGNFAVTFGRVGRAANVGNVELGNLQLQAIAAQFTSIKGMCARLLLS